MLTASAHSGEGVDKLQAALGDFQAAMQHSGELAQVGSRAGWVGLLTGEPRVPNKWQTGAQAVAICSFRHASAHPSPPAPQVRQLQAQRVAWTAAEEAVVDAFRQDPAVRFLLARLLPEIQAGALAPRAAAELLAAFHHEYV